MSRNSKSVEVKNVNKLIFVDNLELAFSGKIPIKLNSTTPEHNGKLKEYHFNVNCYIQYQPKGNRFFENIADLYIRDRKIGEFRFNPRKQYIDSAKINFKYDNVQLYQENFQEYIDLIVTNMGLKYSYISHLEIAVDSITLNIKKFVQNYIERTRSGKMYATHHKGKVNRRNMTIKGDNEIYWGDIKSDKYIKIYNKTAELKKHDNYKNYIPVCWKTNGMITGNVDVERFELTLKQIHCKLLDYKKLNDSNYLASIMETHCDNFFDFEKTITNHNKKYLRKVTPINFKDFNTIKLKKFRYVPQNTLNTEKTILKQLYFQYSQAKFISSNQCSSLDITLIPDKLKNHSIIYGNIELMWYMYPTLKNYFNVKKKSWENEFNATNELKNGKLKTIDYIKLLELTHTLNSNVIDEQLFETSNEIYDKTDEKLVYESKRTDRQTAELLRALDNVELIKGADQSKLIKKISKPVTEKISKQMTINYKLRQIEKENQSICIKD